MQLLVKRILDDETDYYTCGSVRYTDWEILLDNEIAVECLRFGNRVEVYPVAIIEEYYDRTEVYAFYNADLFRMIDTW